jgi:C4-dicarboxylate-specific signal transduction histidine kinase
MRFLGEMARSAAPARPRAGRGGADLRVVLEDAVAVLGEVYPAEVRVEGEPVTVGVDACAARRLVANLLENALVAIGSGGRVVASLHRDGDAAVVEIADSGPGFGPAGAPTFGCGLATVTSLVTCAGGSLTFGTSAWGGAKVTVRLPVA